MKYLTRDLVTGEPFHVMAIQFTDERTGLVWWAVPDDMVRYIQGELTDDQLIERSQREAPAAERVAHWRGLEVYDA